MLLPVSMSERKFSKIPFDVFLCLRTGHISKNCNAKFTCFRCKGKHHVSICENQNTDNSKNSTVKASSGGSGASDQQSNVSLSHYKNNVLLQTARAIVSSSD